MTKLMCHSPKIKAVDCDVVHHNNGLKRTGTHLNLGLLSIHSQTAVTHLWEKSPQLCAKRARSVFVPEDLLPCNFGEEVTL